jgi:Uma2 family endonuclease
MSIVLDPQPTQLQPQEQPCPVSTVADLVERLGGVSLERIRMHPAPGTATEEDVVRFKCCELLGGVIVEIAMGWEESIWESILGEFLGAYLHENRIAVVAGAGGLTRLEPGRIRIPDLGVYLLSRFPRGKATRSAICDIAPDWAIEVLSRSNTKREMELKREHFFAAGTRRMWIVDPRKRTIEDWTTPKTMTILAGEDTADLSDILPGFALKIGDWFEQVDAAFETTDERNN